MNSRQIKNNWDRIKKNFKLNFDYLNDKDLVYTEGSEDELVERLRKRIGRSKEEIIYLMYVYINKSNET